MTTILFINALLSQERTEKYSDQSILKGQYLGQKLPGTKPELFAPDIFSKSKPEWVYCTEFSPDGKEFYFTAFDTLSKKERIMYMICVDDIWSVPEVCSFSGDYNDNDQRLAPDGNTIFWRSRRPIPGNKEPEKYSIIWFATRTESGWSKPQPVKCGNRCLEAGYPSITNRGILYFFSL